MELTAVFFYSALPRENAVRKQRLPVISEIYRDINRVIYYQSDQHDETS